MICPPRAVNGCCHESQLCRSHFHHHIREEMIQNMFRKTLGFVDILSHSKNGLKIRTISCADKYVREACNIYLPDLFWLQHFMIYRYLLYQYQRINSAHRVCVCLLPQTVYTM